LLTKPLEAYIWVKDSDYDAGRIVKKENRKKRISG
jgi:hypothetical protein